MTKIFYIKGPSNSGKSGAIKYTMKMLLGLEGSVVLYVSSFHRKDRGYHCDKDYLIEHISTSIEAGLTADRNIGLVILEIKGKIIGLTTYGDSLSNEIKPYFLDAVKVSKGKLDAFICARHDKNNVAEQFATFANDFQVVEPAIPSEGMDKKAGMTAFDEDNMRKGKELFEQIVAELRLK